VKTMASTITAVIVVLVGIPLFALIASNGPRR
jgi:ABC-type tungstate transport system substrate-binding protein